MSAVTAAAGSIEIYIDTNSKILSRRNSMHDVIVPLVELRDQLNIILSFRVALAVASAEIVKKIRNSQRFFSRKTESSIFVFLRA